MPPKPRRCRRHRRTLQRACVCTCEDPSWSSCEESRGIIGTRQVLTRAPLLPPHTSTHAPFMPITTHAATILQQPDPVPPDPAPPDPAPPDPAPPDPAPPNPAPPDPAPPDPVPPDPALPPAAVR
ncbi:Hypothetical predicted protein [Xyrichtys novacula]|uniref:Uncharacterized protein n=1 Tax=Xyrichtys novacula TaxID=13765 RepID=A0AAV1GTE8_XYRNO|nr:Hypothetical predicted protein [Xyrichtys novacula]